MLADDQHGLYTCVCRHIAEVMGEQTDIEFQELLPYGSTRKTASRAFSHVLGKSQLSQGRGVGSREMQSIKSVLSSNSKQTVLCTKVQEKEPCKITIGVYRVALNFHRSLILRIFNHL